MLLAAKLAIGSEILNARDDIESYPIPVTTVDYIAEDSVTTVPHSCYTHMIEGPWVNTETGSLSSTRRCGIHADCIIDFTKTYYVPKHDPSCLETPTITTPGPSPSCTKGCQVRTVASVLVTTTADPSENYLVKKASPTPLSFNPGGPLRPATTFLPGGLEIAAAPSVADPTCTTVFRHMGSMEHGPTKTVYANVVVTYSTLEGCAGCEVVTRNMGGLGPVAIFSTTVTDVATSTSTSFVCAATS